MILAFSKFIHFAALAAVLTIFFVVYEDYDGKKNKINFTIFIWSLNVKL